MNFGIFSHKRPTKDRAYRPDVYDFTPTTFLHFGVSRLSGEEDAGEICGEYRIPFRKCKLLKAFATGYPSIIDEDIEPTERRHGGCHHIAAGHLVSHINGDRFCLATRVTEHSDGGFVFCLIPTSDHNCGTSCGRHRDRAAPASGAQIAASATGPNSGSGGSVTVAANTLTVEGGAQITSPAAGRGTGGDVEVAVAGDITLPDHGLGPQISAQSTGSGDAGSITLSAARLLMSNGGKISTEATASTANGGNITLNVRDFLYLVSSEISSSVKGETGNGGNILIDPQLAILNHSSIIASAIKGRGGNITINADELIVSADSITSATGQLLFIGPRVDLNGALVVLSSELRGRTAVLREACAARGGVPISSLIEAGRGGLPQDPVATLPALYIAGRDLNLDPRASADSAELISVPIHTTARLTMRCS